MNHEALDLFPGPVPEELGEAHRHMDAFFDDMKGVEAYRLKPADLKNRSSYKAITALSPREQVRVIRAAAERAHWSKREQARPGSRAYNTGLHYLAENTPQHFTGIIELLLRLLCARKLPTTDADIIHLLSVIRRPVQRPQCEWVEAGLDWWMGGSLARLFKAHAKAHGVSAILAEETKAVVAFLRDPKTSDQGRGARMRHLTEELEFIATTAS